MDHGRDQKTNNVDFDLNNAVLVSHQQKIAVLEVL